MSKKVILPRAATFYLSTFCLGFLNSCVSDRDSVGKAFPISFKHIPCVPAPPPPQLLQGFQSSFENSAAF